MRNQVIALKHKDDGVIPVVVLICVLIRFRRNAIDQKHNLFNMVFAGENETNNLTGGQAWLERELDETTAETMFREYVSTVQYQYDLDLITYINVEDGWRNTDVRHRTYHEQCRSRC